MRKLPDWPRLMKKATLAAYLDMTGTDIEREVIAGRLPQPVDIGGTLHWSRVAVDASIENLTGEAVDDWRKGQPLYGKAA